MYGWTITVDHSADHSKPEGTNDNAKGIVGPRRTTMTHQEIVNHPKKEYFKMYDGDGSLYYEGYIVQDETTDGFEPLDQFGTPNAGATDILYRDPATGKMRPL
jgi:hypothetical protein